MAYKLKQTFKTVIRVIDYPVFVLALLFSFLVVLLAMAWILKQRKIWNHTAKGNRRALIVQRFDLIKLQKRGDYEHLLPFRNPCMEWTGFIDPTNSVKTKIEIADDLHLITMKSPEMVRFIEKMGFEGTSVIFNQLIAVFKIVNYCVKEKIGVLRAYKHNYPALRACLVSCFIKIPYIVDISGNYELIRRLTGKTFYLRKLNKVPLIGILIRPTTSWLLGLPLRRATRVLGRNKGCYEHAFALGAPVERLSLLRINNFNAAFNSYIPEKAPANPAEYPYLLFVGRLAKIKYPLEVIDVFDRVASRLPEYRLVIIGDGSIRKKVEKRIARSEYKDRIMLMGTLPSNEVLSWTAHAAAAICPLSGSTLVEAMLCGIPVVAYDIAWHAEVIMDDYTGYLVPFLNTEALAEKLLDVVNNYEEARKVAQRGRELALVVFDKERIRKKESMYYKQALTESPG